jgi:hypothetical protein
MSQFSITTLICVNEIIIIIIIIIIFFLFAYLLALMCFSSNVYL